MKITSEEILAKFNKEEMAGLLVGANERYNTNKGLIEYLFENVKELEEQIKEIKKMSWSRILNEKPSELRKTLRFYEEQENKTKNKKI